jgi:hypothetical protein
MTITYVGSGTGSNSATAPNPTYPATVLADDLAVLVVTSGAATDPTPTTPDGFDSQATANGGQGTFNTDVGPRRTTVFTRTCAGTEGGTTRSVSIPSGNTARAQITTYRKTETTWELAAVGAADNTNGTTISLAFPAIDVQAGDQLLVAYALSSDAAANSAPALSGAGLTFSTLTERADVAITTGLDHRHVVITGSVATGSGSVAITFTGTLSASTAGAGVLLRIRESTPAPTWAVSVGGQPAAFRVVSGGSIVAASHRVGPTP